MTPTYIAITLYLFVLLYYTSTNRNKTGQVFIIIFDYFLICQWPIYKIKFKKTNQKLSFMYTKIDTKYRFSMRIKKTRIVRITTLLFI